MCRAPRSTPALPARPTPIARTAEPAPTGLAMNDIARVGLTLAQPVFPDRYADNRATGSFILIDEATNNTVAAGMIIQ